MKPEVSTSADLAARSSAARGGQTTGMPTMWTTIITVVLVVLGILATGGYFLGWSWTGFRDNTLWDWLQLLVLPVVLTVATIRYSSKGSWPPAWGYSLYAVGMLLIILVLGGYLWNWTWTGFNGNTVWDWLKLLLLPVALTIATVRYSQSQGSDQAS